LYGYLGELLTATEDIRSCGAVPYALRRFYEHIRHQREIGWRAGFWGQTVWTAVIAAFAIGDVLAYGLGSHFYCANVISLGTVYMIVAYVAMLARPIDAIRTQLQSLQQADASIARVRELLATRSALVRSTDVDSTNIDGTKSLPPGTPSIAFDHVSFAYDDSQPPNHLTTRRYPERTPASASTLVLHDLSFSLAPGRVLGLLGRTGSGKTTVARLLFRFMDPQQGSVRLHDVDLRRLRLDALRARVGFVTQDVQLFEASLRDNIALFDPAVTDQRLLDVFAVLGLRRWLERLPGGLDAHISADTLSAGEAQLIALGRVFLKDPGLLILDEASSRLDPATESLLERALDRLLLGRTTVIIAHRLATLDRADDLLILDDGHVLESGSRAQLTADPGSHFNQLRQVGLAEVLT
jgi:ABC-type multidrug transport system fused ATPase/permease subunit